MLLLYANQVIEKLVSFLYICTCKQFVPSSMYIYIYIYSRYKLINKIIKLYACLELQARITFLIHF